MKTFFLNSRMRAVETELYDCVYGLDMIRQECTTDIINPYKFYTKISIHMFLTSRLHFRAGSRFIATQHGNMDEYFL